MHCGFAWTTRYAPSLMGDEPQEPQPTQQTQPKGTDKAGKPYEPVEIPVPSEDDVMGLLEKAAHAPADAGKKKR
jgi:hypothetical protein